MVSTAMQGGCTCENAPYLRIDSNNIAFAAMFAPKPLAMIGADDWTIQLISRGYPELQQVYGLYDQRDHVAAWVHPEFKHNYNHVSRTHMYDWMNEHLKLNASIEERPFAGKTQEELTVFDQDHPLPDDAAIAEVLRKSIIDEAKQQYTDLITNGDPNQKTEIMQAAANILLGGPAPVSEDINVSLVTESNQQTGLVSRASDGRVVPVRIIQGDSNLDGTLFIFSEQGRDFSQEQIDQLSQEYSCGTVVLADISGTGTNRPQTSQSVNEKYYGYTSGYNLPLLSQKVRDISTVVMGISDQLKSSRIVLAGRDDEAVSVLLAQSQLSDVVSLADADFSAGSLREITSVNDPLFLPGFKKYGGISGLATINPCEKLVLRGVPEQQKNKLTDFQRLGKGRIIFKP